MKKIALNNWSIISVVFFALAVSWPIFLPGYFSHHDDLQVMRVFEMRKCIEDFQIPCRWVPDMGYGNGYPLFNYYAVFPYFLGAILSFLTGFMWAAKLLFLIPILLGAVAMYLLAREMFNKPAAVFSSVLYTFAPFKALDIYVRGDVAESFAMAIVPLIIYFCLKLIRENNKKYVVGLALSTASFLTSHNIMTVLFSPVIFLIVFYFAAKERWKNIPSLVFGGLIGVGLAAFFIFPAFLEKNLVQIDNLIRLDLNFRAHFVTINQLFFDRFWGYGASTIGDNDTISFQVGWPYWWLAAITPFLIVFNFFTKRKSTIFLPVLLFAIFLFSVFMTHTRSAFIWESIEILKFVQFPWRFLSVCIFAISLIGAYLIYSINTAYVKYLLAFLVIFTIALNFSFFQPKEFYKDMDDSKKLSGVLWEEQQKAAILDYLPQTAVQPREAALNTPIVRTGKAEAGVLRNKSNRWEFTVKVFETSLIEVPVFDFPVWKVWANGKDMQISNKNYPGRIAINLEKGDFLVKGKLIDTPIRLISNFVTCLSFIILIIFAFYGKFKKSYK